MIIMTSNVVYDYIKLFGNGGSTDEPNYYVLSYHMGIKKPKILMRKYGLTYQWSIIIIESSMLQKSI